MKDTFITSIKELFTNRYLTVLSGVTLALAVGFIIFISFTVHPSELQVVTHYTAYGVTHLYRDQWYYLLSFAVFVLLVTFMHIAIAIKIYITKGHPLAIMFAWFGVGVIMFAWVTSFWIINILSLV
jgi:hypothetical protein